jgi:hypothetical protein
MSEKKKNCLERGSRASENLSGSSQNAGSATFIQTSAQSVKKAF